MKECTDGEGTSITMDTSGNMKAITGGFEGTARRGQMILVGIGPPDGKLEVPVMPILGVRAHITSHLIHPTYIQFRQARWFAAAVKAMSHPARSVMGSEVESSC